MTSLSDVVEAANSCLRTVLALKLDAEHLRGSPGFNDRSLRTSRRETIDNLLQTLEETMQNIKHAEGRLLAARSALPPVDRMPLELLRYVFELYSSEYQDRCQNRSPHREPHPGTTLASVCFHWRTVALGLPTLWSAIDLRHGTDLIDLFRQRAANRTLTVHYSDDNCQLQHILVAANLGTYVHKIKSLCISIDGSASDRIALLFRFKAPVLEWFSLHCRNLPAVDAPLPDVLLDDFAPGLKSLEMIDANLPWRPESLSSTLTSLKLHRRSISVSEGQNLPEILGALPHLQTLDLSAKCDVLEVPIVSHSPFATVPRWRLHSLIILKLSLPSSLVYLVASSIYAPSLRWIELRMEIIGEQHADVLDRLTRPENHSPLRFPDMLVLHNTVHAFDDISYDPRQLMLEDPTKSYLAAAGGSDLDSSRWGIRIFWDHRDHAREAEERLVRSSMEVVCSDGGASPLNLILDYRSIEDAYGCDYILEFPRLGYLSVANAAAKVAMKTILDAASTPASSTMLGRLFDISLKECDLDGAALTELLNWCKVRRRELDGIGLKVQLGQHTRVMVDSTDALDELTELFQDIGQYDVHLVWDGATINIRPTIP